MCCCLCVCDWWLVTGDYDQTRRNSNCAFFYVLLSALLLPAAARQSTIIQWCELSKIKIMKKSVLCHWMLGYQPEPLSNSVCLRIKWQKNKNINKNCDYISEWIRQFQLDLTLIHRIWHSYTIYVRCKHHHDDLNAHFIRFFFLLWRSWVICHTLQKNILRCHPSNSNWNKKKFDHHFRSLHIKGKLKPKKKNKVIQLERSAVATMHILQRAKLICECCHCNKKKEKRRWFTVITSTASKNSNEICIQRYEIHTPQSGMCFYRFIDCAFCAQSAYTIYAYIPIRSNDHRSVAM